ncbi:MAG: hypothetical protein AAGJ10_20390 [Bacteroidota bacterium]
MSWSRRVARRLAQACVVVCSVLAAGCATTTNPSAFRQGAEAPPGQDAKLTAYNVAFGAVVGGLGAVLNGKDGLPLRRFARGAGWGAVGGSVAYTGKWLTGEIGATETLAYGLPARLVHDAGLSVIENAAHNRPPFARLASHLGFVRVDVYPTSGTVQARLLPLSTLAFGLMLLNTDHEWAVARSLVYGTPVFLGTGRKRIPIVGNSFRGYAFLSTVYLDRRSDHFYPLAGHELIHVMQHHEFVRAEAIFRAPLDRRLRRSEAYRTLSRWVYLDSPALQWLAYFPLEGGAISAPCKFDNWLEREAEAFGYRRPVETCR